MSAPLTIAGISTTDWQGKVAPPEARNYVLNLLVDSANFSRSLRRETTGRPSVAFPLASPDGMSWTGELERIPQIDLNEAVYVAEVRKLAGLIDISNEMRTDASFDLVSALTTLLRDTLGRQLDEGLLFGDGADNTPVGVLGAAPAVTADDLFSGLVEGAGAIGDAGGAADKFAAAPSLIARTNAAKDSQGQLVYPSGVGAVLGLEPVPVSGLDVPLVYDSTRVILILNGQESEVALSDQYHFNYDSLTMRIRVRAAVAVPDASKGIRKIELPEPEGRRSAPAQKATPAKKA